VTYHQTNNVAGAFDVRLQLMGDLRQDPTRICPWVSWGTRFPDSLPEPYQFPKTFRRLREHPHVPSHVSMRRNDRDSRNDEKSAGMVWYSRV